MQQNTIATTVSAPKLQSPKFRTKASTLMVSKKSLNPYTYFGAFPGRIFIGALPKDITKDTFENHFRKYGKIKGFFIITNADDRPRGFGFINYADPSVADKLIQEIQIINGQKVEVTRTLAESNDFKTNKYNLCVFLKAMVNKNKKTKKKGGAVSMDVCQAMDTSSASGVLNRTIKGRPMKTSKNNIRKMKYIVEAISEMTL